MNIMTEILHFLYLIAVEVLPTLGGGTLAFYIGFKLYKKQKKEENKAYLHYSASMLAYLNNNLYSFKYQIAQERYEEALKLKKELESSLQQNQQNNPLELRATAKYIYGADFQLSIKIEKISFLVEREPNLLILLGTLINSVKNP